MQITLQSKVEERARTDTYTLLVDGKKVIYKEYINQKGKVIDSELRDENGYEITDDSAPGNNVAALLEEVQDVVDKTIL